MSNSSIKPEPNNKRDMETLTACINSLTAEGYVTQFKATSKGLKSLSTEKIYRPEDIRITNFYRFEGESDPSDNSILYVIETIDGEKGTLSNSYGVYGDTSVNNFIKEVEEIEKRQHQDEEE
ncbi:MAG: hypothetical protein ACXVP0_05145 [Bacteroidia bacterium]